MTRMGRVEEFKFPEGKIHYRPYRPRMRLPLVDGIPRQAGKPNPR
jgi:hypothetical protein